MAVGKLAITTYVSGSMVDYHTIFPATSNLFSFCYIFGYLKLYRDMKSQSTI